MRRALILDVLLGAAAGAGAIFVMDKVTSLLYARERKSIKDRENEARAGKSAYENAAQRYLGDKELGPAIHWFVGISSGALYGLLRNRSRDVGIGSGLAYGLATYLLLDEALTAALKLAPPPDAFPWQTHARGLVGHLVFGAILDGAFDAADLATPE